VSLRAHATYRDGNTVEQAIISRVQARREVAEHRPNGRLSPLPGSDKLSDDIRGLGVYMHGSLSLLGSRNWEI
jgi:hypothetical protein